MRKLRCKHFIKIMEGTVGEEIYEPTPQNSPIIKILLNAPVIVCRTVYTWLLGKSFDKRTRLNQGSPLAPAL